MKLLFRFLIWAVIATVVKTHYFDSAAPTETIAQAKSQLSFADMRSHMTSAQASLAAQLKGALLTPNLADVSAQEGIATNLESELVQIEATVAKFSELPVQERDQAIAEWNGFEGSIDDAATKLYAADPLLEDTIAPVLESIRRKFQL